MYQNSLYIYIYTYTHVSRLLYIYIHIYTFYVYIDTPKNSPCHVDFFQGPVRPFTASLRRHAQRGRTQLVATGHRAGQRSVRSGVAARGCQGVAVWCQGVEMEMVWVFRCFCHGFFLVGKQP